MRTIKKVLQHIFCASVLVLLAVFVLGSAAPAGVPAPAFRPILHDLIGHTSIPILLPSWMPAGSASPKPYADASADAYSATLPDELEARLNRPHEWHGVQAERISPKTDPPEGVPVTLSGGRKGYYQSEEAGAGARPSDAFISWDERGVRYTVYEDAGSRESVMRMANSVVRVGGGVAPLLLPALPKLRHTSIRPVLLPTYLPPPGGFLHGNFRRKPTMNVDVDPTGYAVVLSSRPDVDEADLAYFEADRQTVFGPVSPGDAPVTLHISDAGRDAPKTTYRGHFTAANSKGAGETSVIYWDEGQTRYTLIWLGGSRMQMIRMAESCIPVNVGAAPAKRADKRQAHGI